MSLPLVLVVDDNPENLTVIGELLQPAHAVRAANGGERALRVARLVPQPDLILLDVMMPGMDGYQVLRQLQAQPDTAHIPVIFLTALNSAADEERGLQAGAVDYITKPIRPPILLARVRTQLELKLARDQLRLRAQRLEAESLRQHEEQLRGQTAAILAMARVAEVRTPHIVSHLLRAQGYVLALARRLQLRGLVGTAAAELAASTLAPAALCHDLGMSALPEAIRLKTGLLTADERQRMQGHAAAGAQALASAGRDAAAPLPWLLCAQQIACHHHERWDGSGYPDGLAGDAIPLPARLMALADVYDALTTPRPYREAISEDAAYALIVAERGRAFDPQVVDAFSECFDEFQAIAARHAPTAPDGVSD